MALELPALSAVVARLPDPRIHLAAYGGGGFSLALVGGAPLSMLLAASPPPPRASIGACSSAPATPVRWGSAPWCASPPTVWCWQAGSCSAACPASWWRPWGGRPGGSVRGALWGVGGARAWGG